MFTGISGYRGETARGYYTHLTKPAGGFPNNRKCAD